MSGTCTGIRRISAILLGGLAAAASCIASAEQRAFQELERTVVIELGAAADWVEITPDAVWVGAKQPDTVTKIDPRTNRRAATVHLPGNACGGIAAGFGSLWVPLCAAKPGLAQVDLKSAKLTRVLPIGPPAKEGGITTGGGSVWLVIDKQGTLARIDPASGEVRQRIRIAPGSYNPLFADGKVWVTRVEGSEVTSIDATSGEVLGTIATGPAPRFLAAGGGAVWTLNQGDGTVTRIDSQTRKAVKSIALKTPGPGGDIKYSDGRVWTTMMETPLSVIDAATNTLLCQWAGAGGDSLGIGHGAIWLTDFHAGTIARIELKTALGHCKAAGGAAADGTPRRPSA